MTLIVIGVDGGGSKTRAVVADEHGVQLGEVVGPAAG
jgi:N-acetylglucosamine kinase-like BadF-type ATPase